MEVSNATGSYSIVKLKEQKEYGNTTRKIKLSAQSLHPFTISEQLQSDSKKIKVLDNNLLKLNPRNLPYISELRKEINMEENSEGKIERKIIIIE